MSNTLSRLSLTAALLTPIVSLDWSAIRLRAATQQCTATIGTLSDVIIQSVDRGDDPHDPCGGLSLWTRSRKGTPDPFPIRLWGFTRLADGAAWQHAKRTVHHRLLMQAQAKVLLTGQSLEGQLDGLHLTDAEAARRTVALVSGRESGADTLAGLLRDLHATA